MSACLFTMSLDWFRKSSRQDIEEALEYWRRTVAESEKTDEINTNRFISDRYSGFMTNISNATYVLIGMNKAGK